MILGLWLTLQQHNVRLGDQGWTGDDAFCNIQRPMYQPSVSFSATYVIFGWNS